MGKPKPEGKWLKQGTEIIPSRDFLIENFEDGTSILTISEVYPDDTGDIVYEAHNPLGVAVTTTQLLVESAEGKLEKQSDPRHHFNNFNQFQQPFSSPSCYFFKLYFFNLTQLIRCVC